MNTSNEEKLVLENMRLVSFVLKSLGVKYTDNNYDDLIQIGYVGLVKAARTFNKEKSKFATYAVTCIRNEVWMSLRKEKNKRYFVSLQDEFFSDDKNALTYEDIIEDKNAMFMDHILDCDILEKVLLIILNCLKKRERQIMLYKIAGLTQLDISKELNLSQSYISRTQSRIKNQLNNLLMQRSPTVSKKYEIKVVRELSHIIFIVNDVIVLHPILEKINSKISSNTLLCKNDKIIVKLPEDFDSFYIIAQIIEVVEEFN